MCLCLGNPGRQCILFSCKVFVSIIDFYFLLRAKDPQQVDKNDTINICLAHTPTDNDYVALA